ncbi:MAG: hypothetical protein QOJ67_2462 [Acidimicrobiaceae bacterium]
MSAMTKHDINPSDLEAKMRELQGEVETTATSAKQYALVAGAVAVVAVVSVAFLLGRRRGKKKTTVVEVRRI